MEEKRLFEEKELFQIQDKEVQPLAFRMRPRNLDEVVGQPHLTGDSGILRKIVKTGFLPSLIFWGPPGSGKTSVAYLVAEACNYRFTSISAVSSGVKEIREAVKEAQDNLKFHHRKTVFFIDEIHRFHKGQQSLLLPHVEEGIVTLIGSTTENPSFEIISPLLSRSRVIVFQKIPAEDLVSLLKRTLEDERGLKDQKIKVEEEALFFIAQLADGDARQALNLLEVASYIAQRENEGEIGIQFLRDTFHKNFYLYDKSGEEHFNLLSAYHKSLRGSDPDAAIYWLVRMLEGGEDPHAILRRLIACASEDVGNADPRALLIAVAAQEAYDFLGEPEGRLALAQATLYIASAPKSNASYRALNQALADVKEYGALPVPLHLRNAPTGMMKEMGFGKEYRYPHDFPGAFVEQEYLPSQLKGKTYFHPHERGYEKTIRERLRTLWKDRESYS